MRSNPHRYIRSDPNGSVTVQKGPRGFVISVTSFVAGRAVNHTVRRPYDAEFPRETRLDEEHSPGLRIGEHIAREYGVEAR